MIDYIKGTIVDLLPTSVTVETGNIGYQINITLQTYTGLANQETACLYIHEAIREDAFQLYGFISKEERSMFTLLVSVSGVGASIARMMLSSLSVQELAGIISTENSTALKNIKGIGLKTAQRIIIELRDKVLRVTEGAVLPVMEENGKTKSEALSALVMLGFHQAQAQKILDKIFATSPLISVEQAIKMALQMM
jgi:Holliday junction DNA helicase RuvA